MIRNTDNDTGEAKKSEKLEKLFAESDSFQIPKIGDVVKGTVISVSKSEVKIDINGIKMGTVRGSELYDESSEYSGLKEDDEVEATLLELENEKGEMELSFRFSGHKKAWEQLKETQKGETITEATITDANKGGLMIKIGHISGFLPVSQLSPEHYPRVPGGDKAKIFDRLREYIGKKFEVKIIDADEEDSKLIVSEKAAWEERQHDVIAKYKIGDVIEGEVTAVTDFGVFVEFGEHLEGLIHISELAWQRIDNPREIVREGEKIKAEIIAMEGSKIFLSSKKLKTDPWEKINERYSSGQTVRGKVLKVNPFGLFVELDKDIHGLAHISEISDKPVHNVSEIAKVGDELDFIILSIEPKAHRLGLSLKSAHQKKHDREAEKNAKAKKGEKAKSSDETDTMKTEGKDASENESEKPKEKSAPKDIPEKKVKGKK